MQSKLIAIGCLIMASACLAASPLAQPDQDRRGQAEPAATQEKELVDLKRQLAEQKEAAEWERGQLLKQIDDLRIELAAGGTFSYQKLTYKSADGLPIPSYLFRPLASAQGKVPAVIYVHGSQHGQFSSRQLPQVQALVSRHYVVLAPDYRSSSGYTREFHDAADYGGKEIDDMLAARDYLAGLPEVDATRIAILGLSHGGYNTLMALARSPERFAAGVDFFGPTDLIWRLTAAPGENANAEPGDREYFSRMVGRSIDEAPELYRARSPRYLAGQIKSPLLILHGDKDSIVRVQESIWLAEALEQAGKKNFTFHIIKGGEHGYPAAQMDEGWRLTYEFLERVFKEPAGT